MITEFAEKLQSVAFCGRWSPDEVLHAMPLVLWTYFTAEDVKMLCRTMPPVKHMLEELAKKLDLDEPLEAAIDRYYAAHPIEPTLWKALQAAFRVLAVESAPPMPATRYLPSSRKTEGGVRAGPLARFALSLRNEE